MLFRWIGRAVLVFLGRKAWDAYQRNRATSAAGPRRR